jgi:ferredoxin
MKVRIDPDLCVGHGRCYSLVPELFDCDELGQGRVLGDGVVAPGLVEAAELAVANCPEGAIELVAESETPEEET